MRRFLSIGECMLEMAPAQDGLYKAGFAGDTFNTAWYARKLAGPQLEVAYMTAIGEDDASRQLEAFIRQAGVTPELRYRKDRTIGLYMISLQNGERSFSYWRGQSAAKTLADDLADLPRIKAGDLVYVSGITFAILPETGRENLLAAIAKARAQGAVVAFDPNLRPKLWRHADEMRAVIMQAARCADIILPSFEDEAEWFGDADLAACAARYSKAGAARVVVKNGAGPICLSDASALSYLDVAPVAQVVDSTAAGDAFNAGFLVALDRGASMEQAARAGCDVARKVIAQRGALTEI